MLDHHLTEDDLEFFTRWRLTAFTQTVIDIANAAAYDWTFSQKIRHTLEHKTMSRSQRRMLNREVIARLVLCRWVENTTNLGHPRKIQCWQVLPGQALVNAACRRNYTVRYYRLDGMANKPSVYHRSDPELHDCDALF